MTAQELLSAFNYPADKEKVLSLLPVVSDPAGIRDSTNWTLLHYAALRGWTDVCRLLVEQYQVDPHCRDSIGRTALHSAAFNGWTDVCRLLVEQYQVDPHCRDSNGWTALHWASKHNHLNYNDHLDIVQYLVSSVCCDPLTESNVGVTPLSVSKGETRLFLQGIIG